MGSMNFGLYPMLARFKEFKHAWERPYLEGSRDRIFKNTFADIEHILTSCAENGTRFEVECYDIGHLYTLAHFAERGVIKPPFFVQSVFGILGGIGPHPEDVAHMKRTADRLFGNEYHWSVLGAGPQPAADRRDGGRDGRQRPRRPRGLRSGSAPASSPNRTPSRSRRRARSSRGSASTSPRPTRRGTSSSSRAATG